MCTLTRTKRELTRYPALRKLTYIKNHVTNAHEYHAADAKCQRQEAAGGRQLYDIGKHWGSFEAHSLLTPLPQPDREVVDCLSDIGFAFTLSDLQKPNPQHIQRIFEFFVELSLNATRTTVAPAMKAAADDICGEYSDIFSADTRDMMGFFVICRRMLQEVRCAQAQRETS